MREMKDSGVEWIGKIPFEWTTKKLKYLCSVKTGGTPPEKKGISLEGIIPWITPTDLSNSLYIVGSKQYISDEIVQQCGYSLFPQGSTLLVCIASIGKIGLATEECYSNQQITALIPKDKTDPLYLSLAMRSAEQQLVFDASCNVVPILNNKYLSQFETPVPSYDKQKRISSFLDTKCTEIDSISEDIRKEIETLQEYRKSVITEAVTKGLDPNVEMKDSGVEWIGEIPVHWSVIPFYRLIDQMNDSIVDGPFGSDMKNEEYVDEGVPVIQLGAIKESGMDFSKMHFITESKADTLQRHNAYPKDLAIAKMMPAGRSCEIPTTYERYVVSADVIKVSISNTELRHFINYALNTYIKEWANTVTSGSTRSRINIEKLKKFKFAIPNTMEMGHILEILDDKISEIDSIISDKQKQLDTLAEYRKSLIYEYVTGKKEVPTT